MAGPKTRHHRACSRILTSLVLSRSLRFAAKILLEIMPSKRRNAPARTQERGEPRHGRRVSTVSSSIETLKIIISYSILTVKRSLQESTCATPGARGARTDLQSKKYIIILYYVKPARICLHLAGHKLLSLSCSDGKLLVFDAHTSPRLDR